MGKIQVAIMMGSKNDMPVVEEAAKMLELFGVGHEMKVLSAHRTPKETAAYAERLAGRGVRVVICAAGGSAALSGVSQRIRCFRSSVFLWIRWDSMALMRSCQRSRCRQVCRWPV